MPNLSERRKIAKLTSMYRMVNQIAPVYLVELLNDFQVTGGITTRVQVMGNLTPSVCKALMYKKCFICSGISLWNQLNPGIKRLPTFRDVKYHTKSKFKVSPPLINHDATRKMQIIFTQIRLGFSDLLGHLHQRGCVRNGRCACGALTEHPHHFFPGVPSVP